MIENYSIRVFKNLIINNSKETNVKLVYWLKGNGDILINLKRYKMQTGSIALIMINDVYQINSEEQAITSLIEISAKDFMRFMTPGTSLLGGEINSENHTRISWLLKKLIELRCINKTQYMTIDKVIKYLCIELCSVDSNINDNEKLSFIAEPVHEYLVKNHSQKIIKSDLVSATKIPSQLLTEMFRHTPFNSFNQYLNHIRLRFCLLDIISTNLPIEDIAGKHGFNHYSRFIQLFKEAYGQTPKLIRKKYIGTSISNNETEEIKLDENVFKLIRNIEKSSNNTSIQCDIQFSAQDKQNCIFPYQLYIEMNKLMTLSHFDLLKLKNKLNYRSNEIHLIIDIDFDLIMQNIKIFEDNITQLLTLMDDVHMTPVYKIKTKQSKYFTAQERIALQQLMNTLFQVSIRFRNENIEFLMHELSLFEIKEFKQILNSYFDNHILLWRPNEEQLAIVEQVETFVDYIILPINQTDKIKLAQPNKLMISNLFTNTTKELIDIVDLKNLKNIFKHLCNMRSIHLYWQHLDLKEKQSSQISLSDSILFMLNIFNQLRGDIVYLDTQLLVTNYKNEYQCIALFDLPISKNPNVEQVQLNFSSINKITHAEINMINYQTFMKPMKNDNESIVSEMKIENLYWIGEMTKKDIEESLIRLPSMTIAHIKILI